jgi:mortality factor 4-like protein 1
VSLPRSPTVAEILSEYKEYRSKQKLKDGPDGMLEEILEGLQIYFDKALGTILLYRYEREQYANILRQHSDKTMSEIYGAEHLLRLFGNVFHRDHLISVVQLPMLIAHTSMDQETILLLKEQLNLLIMYIQRNSGRLFLQEYENAAPEYVGTDSQLI